MPDHTTRLPIGPTRGVTLIELLVTMVVSSVVIVGLGSLFAGASADFQRAARMREERYSRQQLEAELIWRIKVVPPEFLPSSVDLPPPPPPPALPLPAAAGYRIAYTDDAGVAQTRKILAYDYPCDDTRTRVALSPPGLVLPINGTGCSSLVPQEAAPERIRVRTGAIFQYLSVVYVVEREITTPAQSFRVMANGNVLAPMLTAMFGNPPVIPAGVTPPLPLAIGMDELDFGIVDPPIVGACNSQQLAESLRRRRLKWTYSQYR